jgi:hypothetical protein
LQDEHLGVMNNRICYPLLIHLHSSSIWMSAHHQYNISDWLLTCITYVYCVQPAITVKILNANIDKCVDHPSIRC